MKSKTPQNHQSNEEQEAMTPLERFLTARVRTLELKLTSERDKNAALRSSMVGPSLLDQVEEAQALAESMNQEGEPFELFTEIGLKRLKAVKISHDHLTEKFRQIREVDRHRRLVLSKQQHVDAVEKLGEKYKNFSGFINEFVVPQLYLQSLTKTPVRLQNFCLIGPPGVGKTAFLTELSEVLELGGAIFDANSIQSSAVLNGLTRQFGNADVGLLFENMVFGRTQAGRMNPGNALFCVDEIEKMGKSDQLGSSFDLMLALLEKQTARRFVDVCAPELVLNLEHINWGFTSNSLEHVSAPLRSRLIQVEIPAPTPEQSLEIASGIYEEEISKLKGKVERIPDVSYPDLEQIASHSPRQQKQLIQLAIAKAVRNGAESIELVSTEKKSTVRMGFL